MRAYVGYGALGAVLGVASVLVLHNLAAPPLVLYDEGAYAQVVEESLVRGDFLTFTYGGRVIFDKLPLYYWLAGLTSIFTEDRTLMIRFPAALAGVGVVALVMLLVWSATLSFAAAALGGVVLLTVEPFIAGAREARLDVLVSFFILLSFYAFWRALTDKRWFLISGASMGLAILAKSVVAFFAFAAIVPLALVLARFEWLREKYFWYGAGVGAAVALPWHLYETLLYGWAFLEEYIGRHVLLRYRTNLFETPLLQPNYFEHLLWHVNDALALFVLALILVPVILRRSSPAVKAFFIASAVAVLAMFGLFASAQTRAFTYLIPLYPFAAVAIALALNLLGKILIQQKKS